MIMVKYKWKIEMEEIMKRSCGILMHISSLPSKYGIGTLGKEAFKFVDFLKASGQGYWQVLPVTPTGYSDSPYQSASTFAGNPYLIDLNLLIEEGLLTEEEVDLDWGGDPRYVDYGKLWENRYEVLRKAFARFDRSQMETFRAENSDWIEEYALFAALKTKFDNKPWNEWDDPAVMEHRADAVAYYRQVLVHDIDFHCFIQYEFDKQFRAVKAYANQNGIRIIGDVPIYVPHDSVDVWSNQHLFYLDERRNPSLLAGVPPDYFTELGQLWGNPIYNWDVHRQDNFAWWRHRMERTGARFDVVRIDHFRGIESYWAVPYGSTDARPGRWYPGPGMDLIRAIRQQCPNVDMIAEDLGFLTPEVKKLLSDSGLPGMRILQFGFDPSCDSRELPHNYTTHCIAYTGTHDNAPIMGWVSEATPEQVEFAVNYLGLNEREGMPFGFARGILNSVAELAILPMQDYLGLGNESRMNLPSSTGWWKYRAQSSDFTEELAKRIRYYAEMSARCDVPGKTSNV
jgi:4-alpha-glucanotransferase